MDASTETNDQKQLEKLFKVKNSWLANASRAVFRVVNWVLVAVGLREKPRFWGIVYDSVTKQPLDPAIVKLVYANNLSEVETCVTDMGGHYGFLVQPGKFKILAKKSNYIFPSQRIQGASDGVFSDLYHGEFIELVGDDAVLAPNIPMDPQQTDWNQTAKLSVIKKYPYAEHLLRSVIIILFWFGAAFALLYASRSYVVHHGLRFDPSVIVLGIFILLVLLRIIVPEERLWGKFVFKTSLSENFKILLRLANPQLPNVILGKAEVKPNGKYFLRANPGKYILEVHLQEPSGDSVLGRLPVKIHGHGVLNNTFRVVE